MDNLEDILESCIVRKWAGESLSEILKDYPGREEELSSLIELSEELKMLPEPKVSHSAMLKCMAELTIKERVQKPALITLGANNRK